MENANERPASHAADKPGDSRAGLASCLALLTSEMPDLAAVCQAWPGLPEPIRAGIVAMVKAAGSTKPEGEPR